MAAEGSKVLVDTEASYFCASRPLALVNPALQAFQRLIAVVIAVVGFCDLLELLQLRIVLGDVLEGGLKSIFQKRQSETSMYSSEA